MPMRWSIQSVAVCPALPEVKFFIGYLITCARNRTGHGWSSVVHRHGQIFYRSSSRPPAPIPSAAIGVSRTSEWSGRSIPLTNIRPFTTATPRLCFCPQREPRAKTKSRSEEHTSELQSRENLVCRLLLEKKKHDCLVIREKKLYGTL